MTKSSVRVARQISKRSRSDDENETPGSPTKQKVNPPLSCSVTPPKQKKNNENINPTTPNTPSTLLYKLNLNTPKRSSHKNLFDSPYQDARRALHSTLPNRMPARENELNELRKFINACIENNTSGSLYISGPPGTGKTAAINLIMNDLRYSEIEKIFINCTAIKSSGAIYSHISKELGLKGVGKTENDHIMAINTFLTNYKKPILFILDELDQLDSKNQSVLYTIFEWPAKPKSKLILIGIANALDLTDRILPRLQARCEIKPNLMHFAPYNKEQLVEIFTDRLKESSTMNIFSPVAVQLLAGKVASVSGDVRRALDIGRRVVELAENGNKKTLQSLDNITTETQEVVDLKQVLSVLNNVYGTTQNLDEDAEHEIPLQQKIVICSLLLIIQKAKNKNATIGSLHEVYKNVCKNRNLTPVDQTEFVGLCSLIESRGIIIVTGKKEPRLHKVALQWDYEEIIATLKDKQLLATILQDHKCLGRL